MQVFISWSEKRAEAVAQALFGWLPVVLQAAKPWMSPQIEAGTRSLPTIDRKLAGSSYGIVIVTPENQHNRWLNYEAGWLASGIDDEGGAERPVVPLLLDMKIPDLQYPLAQFQVKEFGRDALRQILGGMNDRTSDPIARSVIDDNVNAHWDRLETAVAAALELHHEVVEEPEANATDMLRQLVQQSRDLERDVIQIRRMLGESPGRSGARDERDEWRQRVRRELTSPIDLDHAHAVTVAGEIRGLVGPTPGLTISKEEGGEYNIALNGDVSDAVMSVAKRIGSERGVAVLDERRP